MARKREKTLTVEEAHQIIRTAIEKDKKHKDYDRVVNLSDKYEKLISGENQDDLLLQFVRREDDNMFEQRKALTQPITSAIASSLMNPFQKVCRTEATKKVDAGHDDANEEINDRIKYFYESEFEGDGLDYWLQTRYLELLFTDPNAFVVVEFEEFDSNKEKTWAYPYEVPSVQAIDFSIVNNELKWLLDRKPIDIVNSEGQTRDGFRYTLYMVDVAVTYTEFDESSIPDPNADVEIISTEIKGKHYLAQEFRHLIPTCPAFRVGYIRDIVTKGRTMVNPFHAAMPYFMKSIKTVSEYDLTMALHTFPQKYEYVEPCSGEPGKGCNSGETRDGETCKRCSGTGRQTVTTAQDAIYLPMPRDKEDMIPIEQLSAYKSPPIELIKFQDEVIDKYEKKSHSAVFNSQALVNKTVVNTATEIDTNMDSVYDTLSLMADKISSVWTSIVDIIAYITDNNSDEIEIIHRYPADYKLKSVNELIGELKFAADAGAPPLVRGKINDDIASLIYRDDNSALLAYEVRKVFFPFSNKSEDEIMMLMNSEFTTSYNKILYANFDSIFEKLEREHENFYDKKYAEQRALVDAEVQTIREELQTAKADRVNAAFEGFNPSPEDEDEEEQEEETI